MSAVSCDIVLQALTETSCTQGFAVRLGKIFFFLTCWRKYFFTFEVRRERNRVRDKMRVERGAKRS